MRPTHENLDENLTAHPGYQSGAGRRRLPAASSAGVTDEVGLAPLPAARRARFTEGPFTSNQVIQGPAALVNRRATSFFSPSCSRQLSCRGRASRRWTASASSEQSARRQAARAATPRRGAERQAVKRERAGAGASIQVERPAETADRRAAIPAAADRERRAAPAMRAA
jgi:hypothetical protein